MIKPKRFVYNNFIKNRKFLLNDKFNIKSKLIFTYNFSIFVRKIIVYGFQTHFKIR